MATKLRIDFVSDVACPWCVVGLRSLQAANTTEHVQKKYGSTAERSAAARNAIREAGANLGFDFNYNAESRIWNTFDAHRLLHWAGLEGRQLQLKEALFAANFTQQKSTSDHAVLIEAARAAGLDGEKARAILESDTYVAEVRAEQSLWRNRGINAVPSVIFNGRWMVQGGQPAQVFEQAIRQIVAGTATAAE